MMSAMFFTNLIQKKEEKQKKIEMFSVSMMLHSDLRCLEYKN